MDVVQVELLWKRVHEVLAVTSYPHFTLVKRDSWVAVPVASSDHFDSATVPRVAVAIQQTKQASFHALLVESLINTPLGLTFP